MWPKIGDIYNTPLTPITLGVLSSHEISRYRVSEPYFITIFYLNKEYGIKLESEVDRSFWKNYICSDLNELADQIKLCKKRLHWIEYVHGDKK